MSGDEYSSDDESISGLRSEVILGFTDCSISADETPTIEDTFIGGQPLWLHPKSTPPEQLLKCDNCQKQMALLLQAYAPFEGEPYDRVVYIFACKNTANCLGKKGSIKAIRGVCKDPHKIRQIQDEQAAETQRLLDEKLKLEERAILPADVTKNLFGGSTTELATNPFGGNPFGGNPFAKGPLEAPVTKQLNEGQNAEKKKDKHQPKSYAAVAGSKIPQKVESEPKTTVQTLPSYPGFFVYTEREKFKKITLEPELEKYKHLIDQGDDDDERTASSSSGPALSAENAKIASMLEDSVFQHFASTTGHNPLQVLRYSLGGRPLLYLGNDTIAEQWKNNGASIPDPAYNPSSHRQFELQLMPKAIIDLEEEHTRTVAEILNGMSWGTIVVATDAEDYIPELDDNHVGYVQEYCGVQWEEST